MCIFKNFSSIEELLWIITYNENTVNINLDFTKVFNIIGKEFNISKIIITKMLRELSIEYVPKLNINYRKMNEDLKAEILNTIQMKENEIIYKGGRAFIEELKFRLARF